MLLDEHHSKLLFARHGLPVPPGLALEPGQTEPAPPSFPAPWCLKTQVLAGGRGKAGGIRRVERLEDLAEAARALFELPIKGRRPPFLRLEPAVAVTREFYLSLSVSRAARGLVLSAGRQGGIEIESQAGDNLLHQIVDPAEGPAPHQVRAAFFHLGLSRDHWPAFESLLASLAKAVRADGLLLAEINPLALTGDGHLLALDGKVEIDDNVVDLRPDLAAYRRADHHEPEENAAREAGLAFVKLGGWVGLMGNGAGLAMASMDLLNLAGLPAANFLDLGGGADQERMETALALLFGDSRVEAVFINLFGGILSCEKVALALRQALHGRKPTKPVVVRMSGNGATAGLAILEALKLPGIILVRDMAGAIRALAELKPGTPPNAPQEYSPAQRRAGRAVPPSDGLGLNAESRVLVQGITGREGRLHTKLMLDYGTRVVAGVTPFKGGQEVHGVPVYDSVAQAARDQRIDASVIFVPARGAADAVLEAAQAGIPWVVCITEGVPQRDMLRVLDRLRGCPTRLVGPNTPGLLVPNQIKLGILPADPFTPGPVALLSRSGTLTYEAAARLSAADIGQSACLGIGGDPFVGTSFVQALDMLAGHEPTRAVLVLGEIGGSAEEELAEYVTATAYPKPVLCFIAGRTAPPGRRLGHAGAILEREGGVADKLAALESAGITICPSLRAIAPLTAAVLAQEADA